jgi:hypothetical protein
MDHTFATSTSFFTSPSWLPGEWRFFQELLASSPLLCLFTMFIMLLISTVGPSLLLVLSPPTHRHCIPCMSNHCSSPNKDASMMCV